jgi:hypothetical protein
MDGQPTPWEWSATLTAGGAPQLQKQYIRRTQ